MYELLRAKVKWDSAAHSGAPSWIQKSGAFYIFFYWGTTTRLTFFPKKLQPQPQLIKISINLFLECWLLIWGDDSVLNHSVFPLFSSLSVFFGILNEILHLCPEHEQSIGGWLMDDVLNILKEKCDETEVLLLWIVNMNKSELVFDKNYFHALRGFNSLYEEDMKWLGSWSGLIKGVSKESIWDSFSYLA